MEAKAGKSVAPKISITTPKDVCEENGIKYEIPPCEKIAFNIETDFLEKYKDRLPAYKEVYHCLGRAYQFAECPIKSNPFSDYEIKSEPFLIQHENGAICYFDPQDDEYLQLATSWRQLRQMYDETCYAAVFSLDYDLYERIDEMISVDPVDCENCDLTRSFGGDIRCRSAFAFYYEYAAKKNSETPPAEPKKPASKTVIAKLKAMSGVFHPRNK